MSLSVQLRVRAAYLALFVLTACQEKPSDSVAAATASQNAAKSPRKVEVTAAVEERVTRGVEATGTLAAQEEVALAMKVAGQITELDVDLGDRVAKGQVIAKLDPADFQLQVEQASAALQQARALLGLNASGTDERVDFTNAPTVIQAAASLQQATLNRDRAQQLYDSKLIPRSDYDAAIAGARVAEGAYQDARQDIRNRQGVLAQRKSELALAKQQLEYSVLRSPIDGAVSARPASEGQFAAAGTPIVTIVKVHPLRLRLPVPERAAAQVRVGQQVQIRVDGDANMYSGRVNRISPLIDQTNRTLLVEAEAPNQHGLLRPGAFVRAEIVAQSNQPAVFIPASAVVTFAGLEKVLTVENGKTVEKQVRTGRKEENRIEIAEGLDAGEKVIVRPGTLVGGMPVEIVSR
jgi:RND family efflux transporter MFP subunit